MKVVALNGSPKKEGNTALLIEKLFETLKEKGIETEQIHLGAETLSGCIACRKCFENKDKKCVLQTDKFNDIFQKCIDADAIIIGSPVYFSDVTANVKAFIERAGYVSRVNNNLLAKKPCAGIVALRRGGGIPAIDSINHFFLVNQMFVIGSSSMNIGIGGLPGECLNDSEGINTMKVLGENLSWLLEKIHQ
jgi:multimeric flavodoxin WrbA